MAHFILFQFAVVACVVFYFMVVRPVLVGSAEENITLTSAPFWEKVITRIKGWRTIIVARLVQFGWGVVTVYDGAAKAFPYYLDWTPVTDRVFKVIPADMRMFALGMFGVLCGSVMEWLRRLTTGPVGQVASPYGDLNPDEVTYDDLPAVDPLAVPVAPAAPVALAVPEVPVTEPPVTAVPPAEGP